MPRFAASRPNRIPASARQGALLASSEGSERSHRTSTSLRATDSSSALEPLRASKKASRLGHFFFGMRADVGAQAVVLVHEEVGWRDVHHFMPALGRLMRQDGGRVAGIFRRDVVHEEGDAHQAGSISSRVLRPILDVSRAIRPWTSGRSR